MRRSKIVCTLGPATDTSDMISSLIEAGADVIRINRSHGSLDQATRSVALVREIAEKFHKPVAILVDLQGPKIRLSTFAGGSVQLVAGQEFTITTREVEGNQDIVSTSYAGLPADCRAGDPLLIDDGNVVLKITYVGSTDVKTVVEVGGKVSNHKGLNLPGAEVSVPALSPKDREDLFWALSQDIDYVALSFVRQAADIDDVHEVMHQVGRRVPVLAKIEKPQAVEHLDEIVQAFDGIMVARGDLGVEMPLEEVPVVQKRAIEIARHLAKPVIVATQVLESMIYNPRPTRAEASDCANAIWDGADAVMLSGETAVGAYPVEAVETMSRIIETAEERGSRRIASLKEEQLDMESVITKSAVRIANKIDAHAIASFTDSGATAMRLARIRSTVPLFAFCYHEETLRKLALVWGIQPYRVNLADRLDPMIREAEIAVLDKDMTAIGRRVVFVGGMPPGRPGSTNSIRVHQIGNSEDM